MLLGGIGTLCGSEGWVTGRVLAAEELGNEKKGRNRHKSS